MAVTYSPAELEAAGLLDGFDDHRFGGWMLTHLGHGTVQSLLAVDVTAPEPVVRAAVQIAYAAIWAAYESDMAVS